MKIFYKKDFQRVLEEKYELKKEFEQYKIDTSNSINALEDRNYKLFEENSKLKDKKLKIDVVNEQLKEELNNSKMENASIKDELTKEKNRYGGYKKANIEYKNKNKDLKKQVKKLTKKIKKLEEEKAKCWILKKLSSGKTPNTVKTKIAAPMKPAVIKFMKNNFDYGGDKQ